MLILKLNFPKSALPFWAKIWECSFAVLFIYAFFVQNAVTEIGGVFILLCGVLAAFAVVNVIVNRQGIITANYMWGIAGFVVISMMSSFLFSNNIQDSLDVGLRMIEYFIIACSLFGFLISYPQRLFPIVRYLWLGITALCIAVLVKGTEVTAAGAIGLETLNVNLLSSFITVQICLAFLLLVKSTKMGKLIYGASIILALFVQILTASRRGFIIACVFCLAAVFLCIIPRYTKKRSVKRWLVGMVLTVVLAVALVCVVNYVVNETVLGARFAGDFNSGDALREKYHDIAMQEFFRRPIFGVGLNGLESVMGVYSHSLYYETLACTGIIGVIVLFTTLLMIGIGLGKNLLRSVSGERDDAYISKVSLFFFIAVILASGVAVTMIYDFYFYICLAIFAAVAIANKGTVCEYH